MNKLLLELHNAPTDIYEEQSQLKNQLALNRQAQTKSREVKKANVSLQSLIIERHESRENLIKQCRDLASKQRKDVEEVSAELLDNLQKKEQLSPSHPSFNNIMKLLDERIVANKRSINELNESILQLEQQIIQFETPASMPLDTPDSNQSFNDIIFTAYDAINKLRESASIFSQQATDSEAYNSELKTRVENYAQMTELLKNDSTTATHETLVQIFKNIVIDHAQVTEEYLGIFDEIATSFPKMKCDMADTMQKYTDGFIDIIQTINETRDLNAVMRDRKIVENMLNGSIGKYMEGDIPFINYLNFRGHLSVIDIEHVSKEVEAGKVKDRGVSELIDLLQEHNIQMPYKDAFLLRLLLVEHHKVVEVSTKNNKLDYTKNYLNQHKSISDKAIAAGASVSSPLRNPNDLKILMQSILEQHGGENGYAKDALIELLDNQINRLPKKSPSK